MMGTWLAVVSGTITTAGDGECRGSWTQAEIDGHLLCRRGDHKPRRMGPAMRSRPRQRNCRSLVTTL